MTIEMNSDVSESLIFKTIDSGHRFSFETRPKIAGIYWVGGVNLGVGFHLLKKPLWLHRTAMRLVFGWKWVDA